MERKRKRRQLTQEEKLARGPIDLPFLLLTMLLLGFGLVMLLSASSASSYYESGNAMAYFTKQAIFAVSGVAVMFVVSKIDYQSFRGLSVIILGVAIFLLIVVLIPIPGFSIKANGARRWLNLGITNFQPSELAKLGVILYFSARISKMKDKMTEMRSLAPFVVVLMIIAILLYFEPHMSGTILILAVGVVLLFVGGIKLKWVAAGTGTMVAGLWFIITNTQYMTSRIQLWQNPWSDPRGDGYQIIQSLYAIGSGGFLGLGFGKSRQKFLYLPEEHNDFIFAVVCEELGFIGGAIVLILFALLILRGYWLAIHARDRFGSLLIVGVTTLLAVQVFLNIGVVTNFFPVTGISLPFFSYGGTALFLQLFEIGIVLSVSRQIPAPRSG
ncbi:MAG: putative lipid II flippase FtsW [Oscillospiraceae bacterium]|jgi:cell division protein FtsW|nr:putative lipid II flippase FtsW [Oscillospiraceae bacterium]